MNYVSLQFAGPNITSLFGGIVHYIEGLYTPILSYLSGLSINMANEKHTEMIGRLIGFPRPLVQPAIADTTLFRFTVSYYRDVDVGFSTTYGELSEGGLLSDITSDTDLVYLDLTTYKEMLLLVAGAKGNVGRYSLKLIDSICKYIAGAQLYEISYAGPNNIVITFYDVSTYAVYIAGYVLNYLFDSLPSITVAKETSI